MELRSSVFDGRMNGDASAQAMAPDALLTVSGT
jgi:hypothetical protein